jgi:hypothetical protein
MNKKTLLSLIVCLNLTLLPLVNLTSYAAWTSEDIGDVDNDLWTVWGSSATDVYAMGTLGTNLHYDGNPGGNWLILPSISP